MTQPVAFDSNAIITATPQQQHVLRIEVELTDAFDAEAVGHLLQRWCLRSRKDDTRVAFRFTLTTATAYWGGRFPGPCQLALVEAVYDSELTDATPEQARAAIRSLAAEIRTAAGPFCTTCTERYQCEIGSI